jgi:predicted AlkP superfamily pyrophosphatase or phosphodiesterase
MIWACPLLLAAQADTTQQVVPGRTNSIQQQQKPYVILISADGFRYDLADKYNAVNLKKLRAKGVAAKALIPSYPSLTFPNHYTIVTGLYPSHHGLVDNTFYDKKRNETYRLGSPQAVRDGSWYGGTPLWVLAENQQMITASFYWVGSEAAIQDVRPTYWYKYNEQIDMDTRIQVVRNWLTLPENKRPHLITFYLPEVDHEAHDYGIDSKQTGEAVHVIDAAIAKMVRMTDSLKLPVNYIFLSDHGMINIDTLHTLPRPAAIDTTKFVLPSGSVLAHVYANDPNDVMPAYSALKQDTQYYNVYLNTEIPARWHYGAKDDRYNRIGDMLLVPKPPKVFSFQGRRVKLGQHGFDNAIPDMHATFYAWGPAFKKRRQIPAFENIHVYPLIAKILGLTITDTIDGSLQVLQPVLK